MGLLQKAVETYDAMEHLAGVFEDKKEPLAPIGHICTKATIEITVDRNGDFVQAQKVDQKIIIPVTEKSANRSGTSVRPHPLCDQLDYLCGSNEAKKTAYLKQLEEWVDWSSEKAYEKLKPIMTYVANGTMVNDLTKTGLLKFNENGTIKNTRDVICWRVVGVGDGDTAVWTDRELYKNHIDRYFQKINNGMTQISMISGKRGPMAALHMKGVYAPASSAKIISSNDSTNFTYRGRFLNAEEALTIGYVDSQKAHNALKWIVANQGVSIGKRVFVCWNPQGQEVPMPAFPIINYNEQKRKPTEYKSDLYKTILGYKQSLPERADVVTASFEAATPKSGRLAVTYYNELQGSDFLDRLQYWDETCCWYDSQWGTSSPLIRNIIKFAFGVQRGNEESSKVEVDEKIMGQFFQRIMVCRIEKAAIPIDIVRALIQRTHNPLAYNRKNRKQLQFIACAVIRKYKLDRFKEEWDMALEPEKRDRSYQYGRLLAVLEKAERDTYDNDEKREPNAIRMQSVFVQRPGYATKIIVDQIKSAYYPRLKPGQRVYYEKLIGEIMQMISETGDESYNKPLDETYILGYYLQKNLFYTKKTEAEEEVK